MTSTAAYRAASPRSSTSTSSPGSFGTTLGDTRSTKPFLAAASSSRTFFSIDCPVAFEPKERRERTRARERERKGKEGVKNGPRGRKVAHGFSSPFARQKNLLSSAERSREKGQFLRWRVTPSETDVPVERREDVTLRQAWQKKRQRRTLTVASLSPVVPLRREIARPDVYTYVLSTDGIKEEPALARARFFRARGSTRIRPASIFSRRIGPSHPGKEKEKERESFVRAISIRLLRSDLDPGGNFVSDMSSCDFPRARARAPVRSHGSRDRITILPLSDNTRIREEKFNAVLRSATRKNTPVSV